MIKAKTTAFDAVMPVHSFEANKVVFKDGRVAIGFRVEPAEMESWTAEDYETFQAATVQGLSAQPADTILQKTDIYYDRPYREDKTQQTYFEGKMNKHFFERLVLFQKSYLFLSFAPVAAKFTESGPLNILLSRAGESILKNPFAQLVRTLEVAESGAAKFIQGLRDLGGVSFERLDSHAVHQLYSQYFNLNFDGQPTRQEREISNEKGTFSVGEHKVNVVSLVGQGSDAYPAVRNGYGVTAPMLFPLTHTFQCPHILTQALMVKDSRRAIKSLDNDRKINGMLSFLATQDNVLRTTEIEEFTAEIRAAAKQIVGLHLSVVLWDTNDTNRRENIERATTNFGLMFGAQCVVESYLGLPMFFGLLPGNANQLPDRWLNTTADRAACYIHWASTYKSDPHGEYFIDRQRNLVQVNLFNTALENQNAIVIGPTGAGKSYTFGNLIVQRREKGALQIIMDVGGTYRNVVQSLNAGDFDNTYFEYDPARPIQFNPFMVPRDEESNRWIYEKEKTTFHLTLLAVLWKGGKDLTLDKSERTILRRFLVEYYAYLNSHDKLGQADEDFPGMESFYRFVERFDADMQKPVSVPGPGQASDPKDGARRQYQKNLKYIDMHQFFLVLSEFITGGSYEKVLNAKRDVDLSDYKLICFDLAKVQADPDLYPVVAMLITELSLDLFRKFPDAVKYIALDEAWTMLSGVLSEFIESMYRTIRKTNGSVTIITQGINEIVTSKIGPAIIGNSATKIILRHTNPDSLAQLQKPLGFTGHEMDLIRSARSTEALREFFIKQGSKGKIFALEASPQLDAILTSKPAERNQLNSLVKFYQRHDRRLKLDKHGRVELDADGNPEYEEVAVQQLEYAVAQFVEDKQARKALAN